MKPNLSLNFSLKISKIALRTASSSTLEYSSNSWFPSSSTLRMTTSWFPSVFSASLQDKRTIYFPHPYIWRDLKIQIQSYFLIHRLKQSCCLMCPSWFCLFVHIFDFTKAHFLLITSGDNPVLLSCQLWEAIFYLGWHQ